MLTLWFTLLTSNVLSAGSWLSPVAEGPTKDYADCQCCCKDHGGCSADCSCGGEPAKENQTALRSCSGGALPSDSAFVWVTVKFIAPELDPSALALPQHTLAGEALSLPATPDPEGLLKVHLLS